MPAPSDCNRNHDEASRSPKHPVFAVALGKYAAIGLIRRTDRPAVAGRRSSAVVMEKIQMATDIGTPAISLKNASFGYDRHPAIHHLCGAFVRGRMTAVVGPNGAGKSTLLKGRRGTIAPLTGHVELHGLKHSDIAYLPQLAEIDRSFPITVLDLVALGLWRKIGAFRRIDPTHLDQARSALRTVGLEGFEARIIGSLSSGQFQRALFARLLLQDSPLILLDEPFSAIDAKTTADLLKLIEAWHREGRTILAVLHDLDQVRRHFEETLVLARETMAWGKTEDVLSEDILLRARHMCESWEEQTELCERTH